MLERERTEEAVRYSEIETRGGQCHRPTAANRWDFLVSMCTMF